jgi:fructuronate reductase
VSLSIGADADSAVQLSRTAGDARPAAPVRIVHLDLGNFFRAHQASFPDMAPDVEQWGIAAFTGRSAQLVGHRTIAEAVNDPICRE